VKTAIRWSELRDTWGGRSSVRGTVDLAFHLGALTAVMVAAHAVGAWWVYLAAAPLIGGLQHGLVNLSHEAWHGLCFRSRRVNHWVGSWLYSYPTGIPYHHDRFRHLRHHALVGGPDDPDWINYRNAGRMPPGRLFLFFLGRLAGSQLVETIAGVLRRGRPRIQVKRPPGGPSLMREYAGIALCQLVILGAFTAAGRPWEYLVLWLAPLATFASLFITVRSFVEHAAEDDAVDRDARLSDFAPGRVEAFFLAPYHFNFHALHHAFPAVPHYRLRHLQQQLDEGAYPGDRKAGYVAALIAWTSTARSRGPGSATR
jgi:fatty acid desaturase